jgi:serine/threonine protein kinase
LNGSDRTRIEDICHAALERHAAERPAFVAAACGDDVALRGEVDALLAHADAAEEFFAAPIGELAAHVFAGAEASSANAAGSAAGFIGRQVGPYHIVSRLGAGGMGEVYRARDAKLGRDVAIKVLPSAFTADRERLARFEREARLLA